ncbi:hypothetical protein N566_14765, partial [Streptomycetaceae bacterium MP113-05]
GVAAAGRLTPPGVRAVVLGCTHYELVGGRIRAAAARGGALPDLYGSAAAVAAQALRRLGGKPAPEAPATGGLTVLLSGRPGELPQTADTYAEGRLLAAAPAGRPRPQTHRAS